jgi:hypothetical protein
MQCLWHSGFMYWRTPRIRSTVTRFALALMLLTVIDTTAAVEQAGFVVSRVQAEGWQAENVRLRLDLAGDSGELLIARLQLPVPVGQLDDLRIRCTPLRVDDGQIDCPRAQFHLTGKWLEAPDFTGSFRYQFASQKLQFRVDNLAVGGTRVKLSAQLENSEWQAELGVPGVTLSSEDGKFATDKLAFTMSARAQPVPTGWRFELKLAAPKGQAYFEPVFLDLAQSPLQLNTRGQWRATSRQLALETLRIEQPETLRAHGTLMLDFAAAKRLQSLQLQIDEAVLPGAYTRYLQPFLIGTVLDSLETQGRIEGRVGFAAGQAKDVRLKLSELHLDDSKKRFAFYGLNGDVNWQVGPVDTRVTQLRWEGGSAYRLDLGAAQLRLLTAGGDVRLLEPVRIPVLDGRLDVRRFELAAAGTPAMRVAFDGDLSPIGMEGLCRALNWPVFAGTLSGGVPTLEYRDGNLTVGGTLVANVFDGRVEVDQLRLEQPFGVLPRLSAEMKLRRIDLKSATSAFSFGRIEGRLDGDVKNLRLLKWQPVAFDGRLYSTPNDDTRHRISQRAIENISNLGGAGAAGVLSRGFLRFFDDFAYDRIALGCRLQDGVCSMSGLEPHRSGGYYIVKGKLVPRIDVIGFATRVNWDGFVKQLKSATKSDGPVIK